MTKKKERTINEVYEVLSLVGDQLEGARKEIKDVNVKTTVGHIKQDVLTIKEDVDAIAKTVSDVAVKSVHHERRLTRLERNRRF